jgi:hypothetical protein
MTGRRRHPARPGRPWASASAADRGVPSACRRSRAAHVCQGLIRVERKDLPSCHQTRHLHPAQGPCHRGVHRARQRDHHRPPITGPSLDQPSLGHPTQPMPLTCPRDLWNNLRAKNTCSVDDRGGFDLNQMVGYVQCCNAQQRARRYRGDPQLRGRPGDSLSEEGHLVRGPVDDVDG